MIKIICAIIHHILKRAWWCCSFKQFCIFCFHRGKGSFSTLRWRRLFIPPPMSGRREKGTKWKSKYTIKQRHRRKDLTALNWSEVHLFHACKTLGEFCLHRFCKYSIFRADVVAVLLLNLKCFKYYLCNCFQLYHCMWWCVSIYTYWE